MNARKLTLPATKTYSHRSATWIDTPGLSCDGVLILAQTEEKSGELDVQAYGCEEVACSFSGGRSFCVRKLGAKIGGDDEQYTTSILPRNSQCTCKSGRVRGEVCRHRDGLAAMIEAGVLARPLAMGA